MPRLWSSPRSGHQKAMPTHSASFNGTGQPLPGVVVASCRLIFVFLPLAFAGRYMFGLDGLFAVEALSNLLIGAVAFVWLRRQAAG